MRNGILCSLVALLPAVPAFAADPPSAFAADRPLPVTLGRPVPLNEAVHLQAPVATDAPSSIVRTAAVDDSASAPAAIYRAQAGPPPVDPLFPAPGGPAGPPPVGPACPVPACPPAEGAPHFWVDGEFLMWWVKGAPSPFGGSSEFGLFPGLRLDAGGWFGSAEKWGVEGSGFFLSRKSASMGIVAGTIPFPDLVATAAAAAYQDTQLYGADLNGLYNLYRDSKFHVDVLGGFRYLGLQEDLKAYAAGTVDLPPIEAGTAQARLTAQNNFWGPQVGARVGWHFSRWFVDVTGKLAMGVSNEGLTEQAEAIGGGETVAAQFRRSKDDFAVVPEFNLRVGYDITRNIHAFVGYDFLYISSVARPGNQDFFGPASVQSSGYWAQGLNFGVEISF
jgi:Putative beta barrel porin-7 (BBP7)